MGVKNSKYYMENDNIYLRKSNTPSYIADDTKEKVEIKNHSDGKIIRGYYHGYFRNDTFNGKGKLVYNNYSDGENKGSSGMSVIYKGEFINRKLNGRGKKIVKNCKSRFPLYDGIRVGDVIYEGYFVDGKLNGRGVLKKNNYDSVKEYIGTSKWSDGNYKRMIDKYTYEGEFVDDVFVEGKIYIGGKSSYICVNRDNFANDVINGFVIWQRTPYKFSAMYVRNNVTKKMITYMHWHNSRIGRNEIKIIYTYDPPNKKKYTERTYKNVFDSLVDNKYLFINFVEMHNKISEKLKDYWKFPSLPLINADAVVEEHKEEIEFERKRLDERMKIYDVNGGVNVNSVVDDNVNDNKVNDKNNCLCLTDNDDDVINYLSNLGERNMRNYKDEILRCRKSYGDEVISITLAPELNNLDDDLADDKCTRMLNESNILTEM